MKSTRVIIVCVILSTLGLSTNQAVAQENCICVNRIANLSIDSEQGALTSDEIDQILLDECPSLYKLFDSNETEGVLNFIQYLQSCPKESKQSLLRLESSGLLNFSKKDAANVCYALDDLDRIINEMMAGNLSESDAEGQVSQHMDVFDKMQSAKDIDGIYLMFSCPNIWQKFMQYAGLLGQ